MALKKKLTQKRLKELLDYSPDTGLFLWKTNRGGSARKGEVAGTVVGKYIEIRVDGVRFLSHRLAFIWMEGYTPENDVDHIDRNPLNNKWVNLREVSRACNLRNCKINSRNKSGVTGVCWHKAMDKWHAQICLNGKQIKIGFFSNIVDAAKARWQAEVKYGFPNCNTTSSAYQFLKNHYKGADGSTRRTIEIEV